MKTTDIPRLPAEIMTPDADVDERATAELLAYVETFADERYLADKDFIASLVSKPDEHDTLPEPVRRWKVEHDGTAEWAMRKVAEAEAELAGIAAQAEQWQNQIGAWQRRVSRPHLVRAELFGGHLERYALALREADDKLKTLTLPSGQVKTRSTAAAVVIDDEASVLEWAKEHKPEVVKIKESVGLTELRSVVQIQPVLMDVDVTHSPCDHTIRLSVMGLDEAQKAEAMQITGEVRPCLFCFADATVVSIEGAQWGALPLDEETGEIVPGAAVKPATLTATVLAEQP